MKAFSAPDDINPNLRSFEAYEPGLSIAEIRQKFNLDKVIKLASNENMLGACPAVKEVIDRSGSELAFRYPQGGNPRLVARLGEYYQIPTQNIFVANGSDEVIDLLIRLKTIPGQSNIVAFKPCFGVYTTQAMVNGVELRQTALNPDFSLDLDALLNLVDQNTSLVFVTSPDNPSGRQTGVDEILTLARKLPRSCLLVLDEAYIEFVDDGRSILDHFGELDNVAVLRTFSKVYGLAGLRIGYGFFPANIASYLWRIRLPFSVNSIAEEAAIAALGQDDYKKQTVRLAQEGRAYLSRELAALGCEVIPSQANFIMFKPPQGDKNAAQLHNALLQRGIILRGLGSYNLPDWLRLTIGLPEDNQYFLQTFRELL